METENLNYRSVINPIMSEIDSLHKHFESDPRYTELLTYLKEFQDNESYSPYQKDLLKVLKMKRQELNTLLNVLYREFQELMSRDKAYLIEDTNIILLARSNYNVFIVGIDQLSVIPRIGETVFLPSLTKEEFSASYFEVKEIIHHIETGIHTIEIHMKVNLSS